MKENIRKNKGLRYIAIPFLAFVLSFSAIVSVYANADLSVDESVFIRPYVDFAGEAEAGREARNQLLLNNEQVVGSGGFWERSFETVSSNSGSRLNVFHRNDTNHSVTVVVERRTNNHWQMITSMSVPANSSNTRQIALFSQFGDFNAQMRITVTNSAGHRVEGVASVRQTNTPL